MHNITNNSILNSGSNPILTNLVGVNQRNIHTKFEANTCFGFREGTNGKLQIVIHTGSEYMLRNYPEAH